MSDTLESSHISRALKSVHWITFFLIALAFLAIPIRDAVESKWLRGLSLSLHEVCGAGVLLLSVIRIYLVATGRRSGIVRGLIPRAGHTLIYLMLLYQPVIGVLLAQATGGKALNLFSFQLPQLLPADEDFSTALQEVHAFIGWAFLAVITGHVVMGIWHVYVQRERYASEMMPGHKNITSEIRND